MKSKWIDFNVWSTEGCSINTTINGMLITILMCILSSVVSGQKQIRKELKNMSTVDAANHFIRTYPEFKGRILSLSADRDTADVEKKLFKTKDGGEITVGKFLYKVLESDIVYSYRVSNVFLDGKTLARHSIDSVRKVIIEKYKKGTSFHDLVRIYNMDRNVTGDVGWFDEGAMVPEFEEAIRSHKKDEIFTIDVPEHHWYYVTLKTHDDRQIKVITVLKMKKPL